MSTLPSPNLHQSSLPSAEALVQALLNSKTAVVSGLQFHPTRGVRFAVVNFTVLVSMRPRSGREIACKRAHRRTPANASTNCSVGKSVSFSYTGSGVSEQWAAKVGCDYGVICLQSAPCRSCTSFRPLSRHSRPPDLQAIIRYARHRSVTTSLTQSPTPLAHERFW